MNFANGTATTAFDLVVAADGLGSKIRDMTFGNDASHVKSLDSYISYFSIPKSDTDTMWSRAHWVPGGRYMVMRPDNTGRTRVFLGLTAYEASDARLPQFAKAARDSIPAQKAVTHELFQDADWETARILQGMHEADDFYLQHIAQVRLDRWSRGRVALVGDAGYAPSPFTGMGTSIAFIGAYVLAGEISRQPDNIPAALEAYERILRPYFESIQKLPPGIPWIVNPQSALGVKVFESAAWVVGMLSVTWIATLFSKAVAYLPSAKVSFKLPEYEAFKQ